MPVMRSFGQLTGKITMSVVVIMGISTRPSLQAAEDGQDFFEAKIRPLLVGHCYECHSQQAPRGVKGGLRLDSRDGVLQGGDTGPAIAPGNPDASLLIRAVRYHDDKLQMPPKNKRLAPEQIAALEAWVKMDAPDPRSGGI